jgi:hypothetical protein
MLPDPKHGEKCEGEQALDDNKYTRFSPLGEPLGDYLYGWLGVR